MTDYNQLKNQQYDELLEIRLKYQRDFHIVEFFDGVRIDPASVPTGKHLYQTRHDDYGNLSTPASIAPEGTSILVNFCGSIVTDEPLKLKKDETDVTFVNFL